MAALPGSMDSPEPWQQASVGSGEWCPAPIRRDSVRSRTCAENDRQRSYCSEARRRFSGRQGRRPDPSPHLEPRIHATALGRQGESESSHDHGSRNIRHANHPEGRDAVLVALVAGTGPRIGEALAIRTDDFDPLCRLLQVRRSVWRRREQAPKTLNAIRPVDIPESLAQVLCRYIKGRKGHLFTTRAGRLLDSRNVLDVLQQAGRQGGYHAFRRFRFAVLRKAGVPDDLIKLWLGHSQNLIDLYAAQLRYDETYRREWCEKAGLGFELGELGYKSEAPIRPALVA
jgi:integrase